MNIKTSLRGTLAAEYLRRVKVGGREQAEQYLNDLLCSDKSDIVRYEESDRIVIGRLSEKGQYPPDW